MLYYLVKLSNYTLSVEGSSDLYTINLYCKYVIGLYRSSCYNMGRLLWGWQIDPHVCTVVGEVVNLMIENARERREANIPGE